MKFGENDNKITARAYIATLKGLELGNTFLALVNAQIMELITVILHHLLSSKNEHKWEDFLIDLQTFVGIMKDKYGSNSQYSHSPLSHVEKLKLKNICGGNNASKKKNKERIYSHDEFNM